VKVTMAVLFRLTVPALTVTVDGPAETAEVRTVL